MIDQLLDALWQMFEWQILLAMVLGVAGGVIFGALPGLTAAIGVSLLIPFTLGMSPTVALAMLAGMHNGGSYGGAIPAVLLRIPGTPGAICTTLDGFPMAQHGRGAQALRIAVLSSAVGGMVSAMVLMTLAPPLAELALAFGPPEMFWVNVFGLASISVLLGADPIKGLLSSCFGLALGLVGIDAVSGQERFTFGQLELTGGVPLLVALVGMYALPPAWHMAERGLTSDLGATDLASETEGTPWPWRGLMTTWMRGSTIGILVGMLPGVGGSASAFVAYNETRRASKDPDSFGQGNPLGVAASECANNADNAASMIPALTLGVPGSGLAALMLGALLVHGLQPGPELFTRAPDVVYGYMWAMFFTSALLVVLGGPLATGIFLRVLYLPRLVLAALIVSVSMAGVYSFQNSMFDVYVLCAFGVIGYALDRLEFPSAPIVLGLILGPQAEFNLRVSLLLGQGDWSIMWSRTICQILIALVLLVLLYPILRARRRHARVT